MSDRPTQDMSTKDSVQNADQPDTASVLTAGARLVQAREARQLNLRDVAAKTKQSKDTLEAIERMDTAHLPASIVRLQVRNYARFLGLPEDEIAAEFSASNSLSKSVSPKSTQSGAQDSARAGLFAAGGLVTSAVIIGAAMLLSQPSTNDDIDPLAISARLAPTFADITDINDLVSETTEEFSIYARERAWIEVRGSDGTVFRSREMEMGEVYFPRTGAGWTITVRDAGAFEWKLGDLGLTPVGDSGQALYSVSIDGALQTAIDARTAALAETKSNTGGQRR